VANKEFMLLAFLTSNYILFIQNIGGGGIALILLVVLLLFGGRKIPELMRGLGQGMKEFKDATNKDDDSKSDKTSDDKKPK
jgi:sec-independent protein translocase protein TatA